MLSNMFNLELQASDVSNVPCPIMSNEADLWSDGSIKTEFSNTGAATKAWKAFRIKIVKLKFRKYG